jgi:hypothetical protein
MSIDGVQTQQIQTFQVQTQQIQTDNSAVKAIDAGWAQLGVKESIDAIGNGITEQLGNLLGAGVNAAIKKGADIGASSMASLDKAGSGLSDKVNTSIPNRSQSIEKDLGHQQMPQVAMDNARSAVAGLDMPKYGFPQPAVHVADTDLNQAVNSSKQVAMSTEVARSQQQVGLG